MGGWVERGGSGEMVVLMGWDRCEGGRGAEPIFAGTGPSMGPLFWECIQGGEGGGLAPNLLESTCQSQLVGIDIGYTIQIMYIHIPVLIKIYIRVQ